MKQLTESLFKTLEASAASTPRKRAHHNLHEDLSDPVQRLCVAIEPGSYIRPHRHSPGKWELFLIFKGSAAMLIFDEQGKVIDRAELEPGGCSGAEAPGGEWHTLVATSLARCHLKPETHRLGIEAEESGLVLHLDLDRLGRSEGIPRGGDDWMAACHHPNYTLDARRIAGDQPEFAAATG